MPRLSSVRLPANPRARALVASAFGVAALALANQVLENSSAGRGTPLALDFQGLLFGLGDALIAVGLIVVFRVNRIINFSAFAFGVPAALLAFDAIYYTHFPLAATIVLAVLFGALIGAVVELAAGRRFARRSRLQFTILTIALAPLVSGSLSGLVDKAPWLPAQQARAAGTLAAFGVLDAKLPLRGFHFTIGNFSGLRFGFGAVFALELAAAAMVALALFLRVSRFGVALRSVAQNAERAGLLGIDTGTVATLAWAIAGALSALGLVVDGLVGNSGVALAGGSTGSGAGLLTPLTAAALARFRSVPAAAAWAVGLNIVEAGVVYAHPNSGPIVNGGLLVLVVAALLIQSRGQARLADAEQGSWRLAAEQRAIPRTLAQLPGIRVTRAVTAIALLAIAVALPLVVSAGTTSTLSQALLVGVAGLSLVVLTGWNGQVSLGQYAFIAIGAVVAGGAAARGSVPFPVAVLLGAAIAGVIAVAVGLPALRVRGLFLGVVTFLLVPATTAVLFDRSLFGWLLPDTATRPKVLGLSFDGERSYYYLSLVVLVVVIAFVANLRRTRVGRVLIAARDNEAALQANGVPLVRTKLLAFAISGAMAGLAGALLGFQLRGITATTFNVSASLDLFYFTVLGGISSISGALAGIALLTIYHTQHNFTFQQIAPLVAVGIIYAFPGGLLEIFTMARDGVLRIVAQRGQIALPGTAAAARLIPLADPTPGAGLAALPPAARYRRGSRLHGRGAAVVDVAAARDESALTAASASLMDRPADATAERQDA